jgi:hypothetical protein
MAKKILIANPMGHIADTAFAAGPLHRYDAWFGLSATPSRSTSTSRDTRTWRSGWR